MVTGATAAIRDSAKSYLLPIPELMPVHLHDGWMALACSAKGKVGWVDARLISYRQHAGQELGSPKRTGPKWMLQRMKRYWGGANANWDKSLSDQATAWKKSLRVLVDRQIIPVEKADGLRSKIEFLETRSIPQGRFRKCRSCLQLLRKGDYHRYHHQPLGALITDLIHCK